MTKRQQFFCLTNILSALLCLLHTLNSSKPTAKALLIMNSCSFVTHQSNFFKYKDFPSIEMAMQTILPQLAEKYIFVVLQADSFL